MLSDMLPTWAKAFAWAGFIKGTGVCDAVVTTDTHPLDLPLTTMKGCVYVSGVGAGEERCNVAANLFVWTEAVLVFDLATNAPMLPRVDRLLIVEASPVDGIAWLRAAVNRGLSATLLCTSLEYAEVCAAHPRDALRGVHIEIEP